MKQLAEKCKQMHYRPEQVQDFTPTPMTLATTMFYTGLNPYTMEPVYVARTKEDKQKQNSFFFWWKPVREEGFKGFKSSKGFKSFKGSGKY
jgi:radical SAM superfamily enzyme YgiQ (UPF0313 family)